MRQRFVCLRQIFTLESANDMKRRNCDVSRRKLLNLLLLAFIFVYILWCQLGDFLSIFFKFIYYFFFFAGTLSSDKRSLWGKQLCAWLYDDTWASSHPRRVFCDTLFNEQANSIHKSSSKRKLRLPERSERFSRISTNSDLMSRSSCFIPQKTEYFLDEHHIASGLCVLFPKSSLLQFCLT